MHGLELGLDLNEGKTYQHWVTATSSTKHAKELTYPGLPDVQAVEEALPVVCVNRLPACELSLDRGLELLKLDKGLA